VTCKESDTTNQRQISRETRWRQTDILRETRWRETDISRETRLRQTDILRETRWRQTDILRETRWRQTDIFRETRWQQTDIFRETRWRQTDIIETWHTGMHLQTHSYRQTNIDTRYSQTDIQQQDRQTYRGRRYRDINIQRDKQTQR